jgi:hypothetical protein
MSTWLMVFDALTLKKSECGRYPASLVNAP